MRQTAAKWEKANESTVSPILQCCLSNLCSRSFCFNLLWWYKQPSTQTQQQSKNRGEGGYNLIWHYTRTTFNIRRFVNLNDEVFTAVFLPDVTIADIESPCNHFSVLDVCPRAGVANMYKYENIFDIFSESAWRRIILWSPSSVCHCGRSQQE